MCECTRQRDCVYGTEVIQFEGFADGTKGDYYGVLIEWKQVQGFRSPGNSCAQSRTSH